MRRAAGFTFIEVLIALSILVVGSVSILALFTLGVDAQVRRRVEARQAQVRPEIEAFHATLTPEQQLMLEALMDHGPRH